MTELTEKLIRRLPDGWDEVADSCPEDNPHQTGINAGLRMAARALRQTLDVDGGKVREPSDIEARPIIEEWERQLIKSSMAPEPVVPTASQRLVKESA